MKFMYPQLRLIRLFVFMALSVLVVSYDLPAQTKKKAAAKAPAKKTATQSKDAKKAPTTASKRNSTKKETAAKKAPPAKKMTAAERNREAARRKAEEARRQAALAEQRRREQAAREARARKLAFERGLRNETAANVLNDNVEGEDLRVRQVAVNALGERAGTVVVMEAKTGKIVTMVNQEWGIKQGFKPCSTIKLVTGVAGLNENLIDNDGGLTRGGMQMNLDDALARSNNPYFQRVGSNLGSEKMIDYAKKLGLGQKTGINAEGESVGKLPYGNNNPRIYSHADDFEVTPLQLAVMVTAISNGGKRITPQFQRSRAERAAVKPTYRGSVDLPENSRMGVIPGMIGAAEYGTARRGVDAGMGVAGKTGSCIGRGSWVGLFASVAPIEDPKYAVVVITRGEGERGRIAAGIAGQIYQVLSGDIRRDTEKMMALRNIRNRPFFNNGGGMPSTVAAVEEDDEDDDATSADAGITEAAPQRVVTPQAQPVQKGGVVKTVDSKPVFNPVVINYSKDGKTNSTPAKPAVSTSKPVTANKPASTPTRPANVPAKVVTTNKPAAKLAAKTNAPGTNRLNTSRAVTAPSKANAAKANNSKAANKANTSKAANNSKAKNVKETTKAAGKNNTKADTKKSAKPAAKTDTKKQPDGKSRPRVVKK